MTTLQLVGCALLLLVAESPSMEMDDSAEGLADELADMAPFAAAADTGGAAASQTEHASSNFRWRVREQQRASANSADCISHLQ